MKFLQDSKLQIHLYSFSSFQRYYDDPMLFSFFPPSIRINICTPLKENYRTKFQRFKLEITSEKNNQMIKVHVFKKKKEGGEERPPNLAASGRLQPWWPLECFKLGGPWKESNV